MEWKGNFAGESIEDGFSRLVEDRFYVGDGLGTAHTNTTAATVMSTGTIPANTLQVGDLLVFEGAVIVSSVTAGPSLTVQWTYGTHPHQLNPSAKAVGVNDHFTWNYTARVKSIAAGGSLDFADTAEMWHIDSGTLVSSAIVAAKSGLSGPPGGSEMYSTDAADFKCTLTWSAASASNIATVVRNHVHIIRP